MASTSALIVIDGAQGEGGGALLRTALVMSALTQQALRIDNLRGATRHPSLDAEDLTLIRALATCCKAEVTGGEIGATSVTFLPTQRPRNLNVKLETIRTETGRGPNAPVILNALLPVLARTGAYSSVVLEGETYGFNCLSYDYFANVTLEAFKKAGIYATPDLLRAGYGRESQGEVALDIEPSAIQGIEWTDRGPLRSVRGIVATCGLPKVVADRAAAYVKNLGLNVGLQVQVETIEHAGRQQGAFVTVWARYDRGIGGGTAMGTRGLRAETLAQAAFEQAFEWMSSNATVDSFLADQLLLPLVLAEGSSVFSVPKLTQRLLTSISVVKQFIPLHLTVRGIENGPGTISIQK
ncbi:MAG TPA: RNA 3'-terminal phosphate cyclase [Fimbriimonas sp.]|nr:RNA 3'-terminal phosphate cyclase [Fimbriimonas sp.]